jgi:tRNA G18 (ribose-2'-O)-methylase SpoU
MTLLTGIEIHNQRLKNLEKIQGLVKPIIACDRIKTPENIGSFFRLADAFGAEIVFINPLTTINKGIKTACGSENHVIYSVLSLAEFLIRYESFQIIPIELTSKANSIFESTLPEKAIFVFGNESYGVEQTLLDLCSTHIYIPMFGVNNSMNVSHSASIVLYEWRKQNNFIFG